MKSHSNDSTMKPQHKSRILRNSSIQSSLQQPWRLSPLTLACFLLLTTFRLCHAQPTFDECKIFLVASDTARDLSLNKDPEYIRFLNLVGRTYLLPYDFTTYDTLPIPLQTTYKSYAWTTLHEIDLSAAEFGAQVQDEDVSVLRSFCDETARIVGGLKDTPAPTFAPTVALTSPPAPPVSFDQDTSVGGSNLLTGPSDALSELPIECRRGLFGADFDRDGFLNTEEYTMLVGQLMPNGYSHATDFDSLPQELKDNFDRLKEDGDGLGLNVFGAVPSQWTEASSQQRSFLQLICYRTEDALEAVAAADQEQEEVTPPLDDTQTPTNTTAPNTLPPPPISLFANQTIPPLVPMLEIPKNMTVAPPNLSNAAILSTIPPTTSSTQDDNDNDNDDDDKPLSRNVIVAIVGSILIVLLGVYLARDKQSTFQKKLRYCRNNKRRRSTGKNNKISPWADANKNTKDYSEHCPPTSTHYDLDSSDGEQTGFLEDHGMMGTNNHPLNYIIPGGDRKPGDEECQPPLTRTSSVYGFQTVRFNPDEFTSPPQYYASSGNTVRFNPDDFIEPEEVEVDKDESEKYVTPDLTADEENMINADFQDYRFDNSAHKSDDDSSAMSLYCSSVAGEKVVPPSGAVVSNVPSPQTPGNNKADQGNSFSTLDTDLLTEFQLSSPRRSSSTMYHANRFGQIAQSESTKKLSEAGCSPSSPFGRVSGGRSTPMRKKGKNKAKPKKKQPPATAKLDGQQQQQGEPKTPRAANKKKLKKKPNNRGAPAPANPVNPSKKKPGLEQASSEAKMKQVAKPEVKPEPAPIDRFLRYAMDGSDTSDSSSTGSYMTEEPSEKASSSTSPELSPQQWSFSYGGKAYSIDEGEVSPNPHNPSSPIANSARRIQMQPIEITTGRQHEDSFSESTSFLSDDFTDPGDQLLAGSKRTNTNSQGPNATRLTSGRKGTVQATQANNRVCGSASSHDQADYHNPRTKTRDEGVQKPMNESAPRDSLSVDESITDSVGSYNSSFLRDSNSTNKDILRGDTDSTYEGTDSSSSFSFPPESSSSSASIKTSEGDPIQEIHRLVAIVMPSEQDKVTQMLDQYQGREVDLMKTLRRLEVRMKARRFSGARPTHVAPSATTDKNDRAARMRTIQHQTLQRRRQSSVVAENAAMIAVANGAASGKEAKRIFLGGPAMIGSEHSRGSADLDLSSSEEDEDEEFSQDSTYFDDQRSCITSIHDDESLSMFSDLR